MPLPYNHWSEEDIKNRGIAEEGNYQFKIISALKDKTKPGYDKDGNEKPIRDMLVLEFIFKDKNGMEKTVKDWIVFMKGMDWKMRHLAISINELDKYDNKELDLHHIQGKTGRFIIGVKEYVKEGETKKSNFIKDYIVEPGGSILTPLQERKNDFPDDDIPF